MATIFDVAAKAKVSVITVSRLLNNPDIVSKKTADRIFKVMENLNYQPSQIARSLVKKKTNTIGVIMPDVKNTFFNSWFRHVEDYASAHQYNLLLCNTDEEPSKELKYIKLFQAQRVDGIILVPCSQKSVEYLSQSNLNFVLVDRYFPKIKSEYVITDHFNGAFEATEYLIKLGHKKIAVLRGAGELFPDVERFKGFSAAMKKHGLAPDPDLFFNCEFDDSIACKTIKDLLRKKERPTAIFSFNSLMMTGAIKAVEDAGLEIPKQISLICFDEIPGYNIFTPKITSIVQPIESLGREATKILIDRIKNPQNGKQKKLVLKPKLVAGDSCRKN
jgi:LacI family transcriptional regulator